jgi:hypothetical protein
MRAAKHPPRRFHRRPSGSDAPLFAEPEINDLFDFGGILRLILYHFLGTDRYRSLMFPQRKHQWGILASTASGVFFVIFYSATYGLLLAAIWPLVNVTDVLAFILGILPFGLGWFVTVRLQRGKGAKPGWVALGGVLGFAVVIMAVVAVSGLGPEACWSRC